MATSIFWNYDLEINSKINHPFKCWIFFSFEQKVTEHKKNSMEFSIKKNKNTKKIIYQPMLYNIYKLQCYFFGIQRSYYNRNDTPTLISGIKTFCDNDTFLNLKMEIWLCYLFRVSLKVKRKTKCSTCIPLLYVTKHWGVRWWIIVFQIKVNFLPMSL